MDPVINVDNVTTFQATDDKAYVFGIRGTTSLPPTHEEGPVPGAGHLLAGATGVALACPNALSAIEFATRTRANLRCSIYDILNGTPTRVFRKNLSEPEQPPPADAYAASPAALIGLSKYNTSASPWSATLVSNNRAIMTHMLRTETSDSTIFAYLGFLDSAGERNWLPNEALDVLQSAIVPGRETFVPVSLAFLRSIGRGIVTSDAAWRLWKEAALRDFESATGIKPFGDGLADVSVEGGGWSSESLHQMLNVLCHVAELPESDLARDVVPVLLRCYLNHSRIVRFILVDRPSPVGLNYVLKGILGTQDHPRARRIQASFKLENTGKIFVVSGDAGDTRMLEKTGHVEWSSSVPGDFQITVAGISSANNTPPRLLVNGKPVALESATSLSESMDIPLEVVNLWNRTQTLKKSLEDEKSAATEKKDEVAAEGKKKSEREERLFACLRDRSIDYGFLVRDGIDLMSAALTAVARGAVTHAEKEVERMNITDDGHARTLKWLSDFCYAALPQKLSAQLASGAPFWPIVKRVRIAPPSVLRAMSGGAPNY